MQKLISVIVPTHNEGKNIFLIWNALIKVFENLAYELEVVFVNDGSTDNSQNVIENLALSDERVKFIEFSRNFGKEMATTAGLNSARGNAAILIDADLQHPVELIPEFIVKWEAGADTVIGVRKKNKGEGLVKKIGSYFFYKIMNHIGETKIIPRATDFRLINRKMINEFNNFSEHNRITRGILDWMGFKKDFVYFDAKERINGKASYSTYKLLKLSTSTFISHSLFPLKLAGKLGSIIILLSGPLGLFIFVERFILNDPFGFAFSGTAILAVIILFLVGIILVCLGLIALYIGNIQNEVYNRPMYIVRNRNKKSFSNEVFVDAVDNSACVVSLKNNNK
ncbi:MAG: glycosyltransferase family 2 protein [Patescibacteria group bacterium]|nr:glycosyltransferase family 2 protein [Patescibacteria group bacterium]